MDNFLKDRVINLAQLSAVILAVVTLWSFAAGVSHTADLLTSFRHIYVMGGLPVMLALIASDRRRLATLTAVVTAVNFAPVQPALPRGSDCEPNFTVVTFNALSGRSDVERTVQLMSEADADLIVVTELGADLSNELQKTWRYFIAKPNPHTSGMGIFSRVPLSNTKAQRGAWFPQLTGVASVHNKRVRVLAVHPPPPVMEESAQKRNEELTGIATQMNQFGAPAILAGDLNATRQSPYFHQLLDAGLVDSRVDHGVSGTWPAKLPLRIGIDHVLHTQDIQTCSTEVGEPLGADHLPFIVRLRL